MGVRNLVSEFQGSGYSVTLDGPLGTERDYEAHVAGRRSYEPVSLHRHGWNAAENATFRSQVKETVRTAMGRLGVESLAQGDNWGRCGFSGDFSPVADFGVLEIGVRPLLQDLVVAVGPAESFRDKARDPEGHGKDIFLDHAMSAKAFAETYGSLVSNVAEYLRLTLLKSDVGNLPAVEGDVAERYALPADADARIAALGQAIKSGTARLLLPGAEAIAKPAPGDWEGIVASAIEIGAAEDQADDERDDWDEPAAPGRELPSIVVPTYSAGGAAMLWQPGKPDGTGIAITVPGDLRAYMDTLPKVNGIAAIPRDERTEAWFAARQEKAGGNLVIVSAEQYAEFTGTDCWVPRIDGEGRKRGVTILHSAPDLAPSMAP
jgi:hypothetical protein